MNESEITEIFELRSQIYAFAMYLSPYFNKANLIPQNYS